MPDNRFLEVLGGQDIVMIGGGSLGSKVVPTLFAKGVHRIHIWDDDVVEERNLYNQRFLHRHIGMRKVEAIADYCTLMIPHSKTELVLHPEKIVDATVLSGIVLSGVDSMKPARTVVRGRVFDNQAVPVFIDGRVGMDGGKVFGFDPNNEEHKFRYANPPHWHDDPPDRQEGACKTKFPRPEISDIVAAHMIQRLNDWLEFAAGERNPYMHFYGFCFDPVFSEAREFWDLPGTDGDEDGN